jgi:hypothetical protein
MGLREFKVRITKAPSEASSENVRAWVAEALADNSKRLASDPGAGEEKLTLRVDSEQITELANRKQERIPVLLRRVIASHVTIPDAEKGEKKSAAAVAADLIPDRVLPLKLRYDETDFIPIVESMDSGLAMAYRRIYKIKDIETARTPEADRKLAVAMAECVNRRSPKWLLENADLFRLLTSSLRWSFAQTEALEKNVADEKARRHSAEVPSVVAGRKVAEMPAQPSEETIAEEVEHLGEPVQREGQF